MIHGIISEAKPFISHGSIATIKSLYIHEIIPAVESWKTDYSKEKSLPASFVLS